MKPNNHQRDNEDPDKRYLQEPPVADAPSLYYDTRRLNPGDEIVVYHNQEDDNTVLTDLHTVEYEVGQRNLFPATHDLSSDSSNEFQHPVLHAISEEDGRSTPTPGGGRSTSTPGGGRSTSTPGGGRSTSTPGGGRSTSTAGGGRSTSTAGGGRSTSTPGSLNPVPFAPDSKMPAKDIYKKEKHLQPDPNWKAQLQSEIGSLPSPIPNLQYDDQGRASKEELKNNPAAVARVGAHAKARTEPDPNWEQDLESEIMALPTPVRPIASLDVQYDDRGRATKSRAVQIPAIAGRVGAHSVAGPGVVDTQGIDHRSGLVRDGSGDVSEERRSRSSQPTESGHSQEAEDGTPNVPFWQKPAFMMGAGILLLIVLVAVVVPFVIPKNREGDPVLGGNTSPPTEEVISIAPIPDLPEYTLVELEVEDSVPHQAYDFVTNDPNWNSYEDWRRQQRFSVACFFFAFRGELTGSNEDKGINEGFYNQHECEWAFPWNRRCPGGDDGIVRVMTVFINSYAGYVPPEVSLLSHLEILEFTGAKLVSMERLLPLDIPNSLASLTELRLIDSGIAGSIPSTFGLLTSLINLDLTNNNLESTIPSEVGLLSNLTSLILSENTLSGTVPEELGNLSSLEIFEIVDNGGVEPGVPSGFCTQNYTSWKRMKTDWCSDPTQCCTLLAG
jgi:hypothetical protein